MISGSSIWASASGANSCKTTAQPPGKNGRQSIAGFLVCEIPAFRRLPEGWVRISRLLRCRLGTTQRTEHMPCTRISGQRRCCWGCCWQPVAMAMESGTGRPRHRRCSRAIRPVMVRIAPTCTTATECRCLGPGRSADADRRQLGQGHGLLGARSENLRLAVHDDLIALVDHAGGDAYAELGQLLEDLQLHGEGVAELHRAGELHGLAQIDG